MELNRMEEAIGHKIKTIANYLNKGITPSSSMDKKLIQDMETILTALVEQKVMERIDELINQRINGLRTQLNNNNKGEYKKTNLAPNMSLKR